MNPKTLLDAHAIDPKKSLGQNFLHDPNALHKIVAAAELAPDDTVLEIGAGTGALTAQLAEAVPDGRVVAVEIDNRLLPILNQTLANYPNVELVCADILKTNVAELVGTAPYSVVANLPYYITSAILRHLLEADHKPRCLVLTVQEEVAERLSARPGNMSVLAVSVQFYGQPYIVTRLGAAAFWPRPDVGSAVVRIDVYNADQRPVAIDDEALFFRIVRAGFGQKRKQLKNSLSAGLNLSPTDAGAWLEQAGVDPMRRAETLTLTEWAALCQTINA
jgi:16S rRNA (adenine1518-N6/adenine1519-N6)-dimethyltransferase